MESTIARHQKLAEEKRKIDEQLAKLAKDSEYLKDSECRKAVEEILERHEREITDLVRLFPEVTPAPSSKKPGQATRRQRQRPKLVRYQNPHTEEIVESRSLNNKTLKAWVEKHGKDTVKSWGEPVSDEADSH